MPCLPGCDLRHGPIPPPIWIFFAIAVDTALMKTPAAMLDTPLASASQVATVEVRLPGHDVVAWVDEMRCWLNTRHIEPLRLISTGNSSEIVVLCEFGSSGEAEKFAREFAGTLV